jgi:GNAT superfamily N-acetyltransferase
MERIQMAEVSLRDAGPDDAAELTGMLRLLSPTSAFMRFLAGFGEPKPALVRALLAAGPERGALLALLPGGSAVGHACWSVSGGVVDVGVVVLDGWQRRGIGRALVEAAVTRAGAAGGTALHLDVHPENRALLTTLRTRMPTATRRFLDGLVTFDVPLADVVPHGSDSFPHPMGHVVSPAAISR